MDFSANSIAVMDYLDDEGYLYWQANASYATALLANTDYVVKVRQDSSNQITVKLNGTQVIAPTGVTMSGGSGGGKFGLGSLKASGQTSDVHSFDNLTISKVVAGF